MVEGNSWRNLGVSVPVYTNDKNRAMDFSLFMPLWAILIIQLFAMFNAMLWGGIGLYEAGSRIIGAF